jgi:hypothetical protein
LTLHRIGLHWRRSEGSSDEELRYRKPRLVSGLRPLVTL